MAAVTQEQFLATYTSFETRLGQFEARLNDLFQKVDTKFEEQNQNIQEVRNQFPELRNKMETIHTENERIKTETPQRLKEILDESRAFVLDRTERQEKALIKAQETVIAMQSAVAQLRADANLLNERTSSGHSGGGTSGPSGSKSLLDTKNFTLTKVDGDKESKIVWEDWREDLEEYLNALRPEIKKVLQKAARWKFEITEDEFEKIADAAGTRVDTLKWSYKSVNEELATFVKRHVTGRARKAFQASLQGGFDGHRRMVAEIDPVNHRTKAGLTD